jgi:hypothetical protein
MEYQGFGMGDKQADSRAIFDEMLCWTRIGGLDSRKVLRSMELMSGEVMPRVRKAVMKLAA